MNIIIFIILGFIVLLGVFFVYLFNTLVRLRNRVDEAWADIEVQLKRRYDLIPNVLETVRGYASYEKSIFENVTKARSQAIGARTTEEHVKSESMLTSTLKTLFAVAENYPDLKANANFLDMQRELADTENKIQAARRFYNTNVLEYNTTIESFPANLIVEFFRFTKREFYDLEDNSPAQEPVRVNF